MKDVMLITYDNYLDLEIEDGFPVLLPDNIDNNDQRACVSAYMAKGTVPGAPDIGVDWSQLLMGKENLINIDNDVKRAIDDNGGTYGVEALTYYPLYNFDEKTQAMSLNVVKLREGVNVTA